MYFSACHTTRGPYYGEEDGSDYHFVLEEEFQHMIQMVWGHRSLSVVGQSVYKQIQTRLGSIFDS